jgi:hypothetical protein
LTKYSSGQALNISFSHPKPISQLNLLQDLALGSKGRRKESFECFGVVLAEGWSELWCCDTTRVKHALAFANHYHNHHYAFISIT